RESGQHSNVAVTADTHTCSGLRCGGKGVPSNRSGSRRVGVIWRPRCEAEPGAIWPQEHRAQIDMTSRKCWPRLQTVCAFALFSVVGIAWTARFWLAQAADGPAVPLEASFQQQ